MATEFTTKAVFSKISDTAYRVTVNGDHVCQINKSGFDWIITKSDGRVTKTIPTLAQARKIAKKEAEIKATFVHARR